MKKRHSFRLAACLLLLLILPLNSLNGELKNFAISAESKAVRTCLTAQPPINLRGAGTNLTYDASGIRCVIGSGGCDGGFPTN